MNFKSLLFLLPFMLIACSDNVTKKTDSINIYNWSDYVDPQTVDDFGQENNLRVYYDYYDSNEMLEAKVFTGHSGYDVVVPSSGSLTRQIQAGAYQKLDKSLIPNYQNIDPLLLKLLEGFDPGNQYAVPYIFSMNTIGVNRQAVEKAIGGPLPDNEWDLVFDPKYTQKLASCGISYLDSPTEVVPLALHYLGLPEDSSKPEDLQAAFDLMQKVRPHLKRFSSSGYINDLVRSDLCVVIGYSNDINVAATRAKENNAPYEVQALMPSRGAGIQIDAMAIPINAPNFVNAHRYINHTLDENIAARNGNYVTAAIASLPAKALMDPEITANRSIFPNSDDLSHSFAVKPFTMDGNKLIVRMWQELKSSK